MAEAKTIPTKASVPAFLAKVKDPGVRADCEALVAIMSAVTKSPPVLWGTSLVGFGAYRYKYATGREGDWPLVAFSPRAKNLVIYVMPGFDGYNTLIAALGPVKRGVSCIYVKRLAELHQPALEKLLNASVAHLKNTYGARR